MFRHPPYRSGKKDSSKEESKENPRFPKRFQDYKEACKGVPDEVWKARLKAKVCTRCGKGAHDAKFCASEANPNKDVKKGGKDKKDASPSVKKEAQASAISAVGKPTPQGFSAFVEKEQEEVLRFGSEESDL